MTKNKEEELTLEEIKANRLKWLRALESGHYNQTVAALCDADGFCCLGVWWKLSDSRNFKANIENYMTGLVRGLEKTVANFDSDMLTTEGRKQLGMSLEDMKTAIYMNDGQAEGWPRERVEYLKELSDKYNVEYDEDMECYESWNFKQIASYFRDKWA